MKLSGLAVPYNPIVKNKAWNLISAILLSEVPAKDPTHKNKQSTSTLNMYNYLAYYTQD